MLSRTVRISGFLAALVLLVTSAFADELKAPPPPRDKDLIPAGSVLHMKLTTTLTSKTNKSGDAFTGQISQPIVVDGKEVVPKFSQVTGHVAFVKPSKRVKGKAEMRLVLDKVVTPDEDKAFKLPSTLDDSNNAPCAHTKDDEGTLEGCGKSKKGHSRVRLSQEPWEPGRAPGRFGPRNTVRILWHVRWPRHGRGHRLWRGNWRWHSADV